MVIPPISLIPPPPFKFGFPKKIVEEMESCKDCVVLPCCSKFCEKGEMEAKELAYKLFTNIDFRRIKVEIEK